ncbi:MAG: outer membrane beta-barrel protein [Pseudomonadota bacterium]
MKKFLVTSAITLMSITSAIADDAEINTSGTDWSGYYLGVQAGYVDIDSDNSLSVPGNAIIAAAIATANAVGSTDVDPNGFTIGLYGGVNRQRGNIVYGIEGDVNYADVDDTGIANTPMGLTAGRTTDSFEMDFFGTLRGRLGMARDNVLWFATGGLAFANVDFNRNLDWAFIDGCPAVGGGLQRCHSGGAEFDIGYTLGGGFEVEPDNGYRFKFEYLYTDLGDESFQTINAGGPGLAMPPQNIIHNVDLSFHTVRLGISKPF